MFEKASRLKLRFQTVKGHLSSEDLWDLSLQQLNAIAKSLNKEIKASNEEDFLGETSAADTLVKLRFDIVLHIINLKKAENDARSEAASKKAQREKILEIMSKKQDSDLEGLSLEDLKKRLDDL